MMERFISRGLICKCATHFSPPAKKDKTYAHFIRVIPSEKKSKGFVKGQGDREKRSILH